MSRPVARLSTLVAVGLSCAALAAPAAGPASGEPMGARLRACPDAAIRTTLGHIDSGAGTAFVRVRFRNTSHRRCRLFGYPHVALVKRGHVVGAWSTKDRAPHRRAVLRPRQRAFARLSVSSAFNYGSRCRLRHTTGVRVVTPHSSRHDVVRKRWYGCANTRIHLLSVGPVRHA